jgi:hypothetical protein
MLYLQRSDICLKDVFDYSTVEKNISFISTVRQGTRTNNGHHTCAALRVHPNPVRG